jgi:hypothetical protein
MSNGKVLSFPEKHESIQDFMNRKKGEKHLDNPYEALFNLDMDIFHFLTFGNEKPYIFAAPDESIFFIDRAKKIDDDDYVLFIADDCYMMGDMPAIRKEKIKVREFIGVITHVLKTAEKEFQDNGK